MAADAGWLFPGRIARLRIPEVGNFVLSTPVYLPRWGKVTTTTVATAAGIRSQQMSFA